MRAILLAAGQGSRLRPLTNDIPKCMIKFNSKTLLERLIDTFRNCGINDIIIVKGYKSENIHFPDVKYIHNLKYAESGIMESLFCAREKLEDTVIISYTDIIFEKNVLMKLIKARDSIAGVVDTNWKEYWKIRTDDPLSDAESLVLDNKNYITDIGKKNLKNIEEIDGQFIGLIKFQNKSLNNLKNFYDKIRRKATNEVNPLNSEVPFKDSTLTNLLRGLIKSGKKIRAIPIKNGWLEFDTINDYTIYNNMLKNGSLSKFISLDW